MFLEIEYRDLDRLCDVTEVFKSDLLYFYKIPFKHYFHFVMRASECPEINSDFKGKPKLDKW